MTQSTEAFEEFLKAEYIKTGFVWDKEHAKVFYEAGQRQGMERATEMINHAVETYGIQTYMIDYLLEDIAKGINP